jgi:hypothetical protein
MIIRHQAAHKAEPLTSYLWNFATVFTGTPYHFASVDVTTLAKVHTFVFTDCSAALLKRGGLTDDYA